MSPSMPKEFPGWNSSLFPAHSNLAVPRHGRDARALRCFPALPAAAHQPDLVDGDPLETELPGGRIFAELEIQLGGVHKLRVGVQQIVLELDQRPWPLPSISSQRPPRQMLRATTLPRGAAGSSSRIGTSGG